MGLLTQHRDQNTCPTQTGRARSQTRLSVPLAPCFWIRSRSCKSSHPSKFTDTFSISPDLFPMVSVPPTSLFDLDASNVTHLLQAGSVVTVIKLDIALSGAARPDNKNKNAWDDTRFRLQAGQIHEDWFLYVSDPSIAAECLRRHFVSTRDIVALFLRRGTPFVLGYEGDRPIPVPQPTRLAMIMPHDFAGDLTLFVEWETKARNFMQGPKSHLVWRLGGVYWRIALHLTGTI